MITGIYIGSIPHLRGEKALIKYRQNHRGVDSYSVQFNNLDLGLQWTHHWRFVDVNDFQIESHNNLAFNVGGIA